MLILDLRLLIRSNFAVQLVMEVRAWPQLNRLQVITDVFTNQKRLMFVTFRHSNYLGPKYQHQ